MSFGWSVGDLIQGVSIGIKAVEALNTSRGAPAGFQEISRFLYNVQQTLEPLQNASAALVYSSSRVEIENQVRAIDAPLREILNAIQKYDAKLGSHVDPKWYKHAPQKLLWEFWGSSKANASRLIVESHLQTLTLLLQRLTYEKVNTLPVSADTAQITKDALSLYDKDVLSQRHFEIMSLLRVIQQQQSTFRLGSSTPNLGVESLDPPRYNYDSHLNRTISSADIQMCLEKLKPYAQQEEMLSHALQAADNFFVEDRFARDIRFWLEDMGEQWLWIQGPSTSEFSTLACASILGAAHEAKVFTLHYFCQQEVAQSTTSLTETELLLRLVYCIIYQCIEFSLDSPSNLSHIVRRIDHLDGKVESLPEAFVILERLLAERSRELLIVLDGLHLIDDLRSPSTKSQAHDFLNLLRQCNKSSVNQLSKTKVILGTPGQTPLIQDSTQIEEQLDAMRTSEGGLCLRSMLSVDDFYML